MPLKPRIDIDPTIHCCTLDLVRTHAAIISEAPCCLDRRGAPVNELALHVQASPNVCQDLQVTEHAPVTSRFRRVWVIRAPPSARLTPRSSRIHTEKFLGLIQGVPCPGTYFVPSTHDATARTCKVLHCAEATSRNRFSTVTRFVTGDAAAIARFPRGHQQLKLSWHQAR